MNGDVFEVNNFRAPFNSIYFNDLFKFFKNDCSLALFRIKNFLYSLCEQLILRVRLVSSAFLTQLISKLHIEDVGCLNFR